MLHLMTFSSLGDKKALQVCSCLSIHSSLTLRPPSKASLLHNQ